ncbi:MAG TPA: alpha-glucosidase [Mogibacterium sp.]|nr:alpha-glucosidase [Mogibacterium sp.]
MATKKSNKENLKKGNAVKTDWYKEAVVYQIYPFSYKDSNNDGIGDIEGIISKLDYIKDLGITAIWFSPLYKSPWKDYGYDIEDYKGIHPSFGMMEDFDRLIDECHKRDIKVIMDLVVNHTSDQHEWFKKALADKNSPYRDYYIFREGRRKGDKLLPPTNWTSSFTGSAWERVEGTDEFYLHLFTKEQPDLNWENPEVREAVSDILIFWMDRGVDGFRLDVFNLFSKVYPFKDDRTKGSFQKGMPFFVDGPRMHEFLKEMNEKALSKYDSYTVGETYFPDNDEAHEYIKRENKELDTIFHFEHLAADNAGGLKYIPKPFNLVQFKKGFFEPQKRYFDDAWNTLVLENHDQSRSNSRFGIDTKKFHYEASTFLALVTFMGWGTPFIYQGEEIGMTNSDFGSMEDMRDPVSRFVFDMATKYGMPKKLAFNFIKTGARDNARVPMHWNSGVNGGFNEGAEPWQPMNSNYNEVNAEDDIASPKSIYRFYQKLLGIKKNNKTAIYGRTKEFNRKNRKVISYSRTDENGRLLVIGNFSGKEVKYEIPSDFNPSRLKAILTNYEYMETARVMTLRPYEAILFEEAIGKNK